MRLYRLPHAAGIDSLTAAEAETPVAGRGQALIRMRAASLNYRDLMIINGRAARGAPPANLVPLSDGAGEVVAVGPEVTRVKPGDRVAACFMQSWIGGPIDPDDAASSMGGAIDGVLSEYCLFDQNGLVHLPPHLSFEQGATLPCAGVTAWNALFGGQTLFPGDSVLVLGTGGVSVFALQFAHGMGARVICTSSSDAKLERVRALGASDTINYTRTPDWQDEVRRLTGKAGVDLVAEVGGAGTLARSMQATRAGGRIAVIGVLTGRAEIDPGPILFRRLCLQGILVGSRRMFETMNRAIEALSLQPVIGRRFGFDEVPAALSHLKSGGHFGKVVISAE